MAQKFMLGLAMAAAIIASCAGCGRVAASPPSVSVRAALPLDGRCDFNRVIASPTGSIAVYKNRSALLLGPGQAAEFVGGDRILVRAADGSNALIGTKAQSMEVIGWLNSGSLLVRVARNEVFAVGASKAEATGVRIAPSIRIEPGRSIDNVDTLRDTGSSGNVRTLLVAGFPAAKPLQVVENGGQLELHSAAESAGPAIGLSDVRLSRDQGRLRWTFAGDRGTGDGLPYQLPVIDHGSGERIGTFGPKAIRWTAGAGHGQAVAQIPPNASIVDVSVAGTTQAILLEYADGSRALLTSIGGSPFAAAEVCRATRAADRQGTTAIEVVTLPPADPATAPPVAILHRYVRTPAKCLIAYFHGGPESSARLEGYSRPFVRLSDSGCDLLTVDYSGSTGGGIELSAQVRRLGFSAFDRDADSLERWLNTQPYERVAVLGVSFGAAPALAARAALGPEAKLVLIAPMISVEGGGQDNVGVDNRAGRRIPILGTGKSSAFGAFAATFYGPGGAESFNAALKKAYAAHSAGARIYLGQRDRKVDAQQIMKAAPDADFKVYPFGHEVVTSLQTAWDDAAQVIKGLPTAP